MRECETEINGGFDWRLQSNVKEIISIKIHIVDYNFLLSTTENLIILPLSRNKRKTSYKNLS